MTRPVQRGIARAVIALLLLGQMMVAAYACPRVGANERVTAEATPYAASADVANQAAEVLSSFYVVHIPSARGEVDQNSTPTEAINAIPPPHAILHCCFRI